MSLMGRERDPSILSDELNSRLARLGDRGNDEEKLRLLEESETTDDLEDVPLSKERQGYTEVTSNTSIASSLVWMVINTLATIGIVC